MIYGMYLSTMGAMVQASRHGNIANNLANANTTGFKPDWTVFQAVDAESVRQGGQRETIDRILEKTGGGVWLDDTVSNFQIGALTETGNPLDMALDDGGETTHRRFFMVRPAAGNGAGEVRYTRDGSFRINADGQLVTASGDEVLSVNQESIVIPDGARVQVAADGTIFDEANNAVAQVGVMRTGDLVGMTKIGRNLYEAGPEVTLLPNQANVIGGHLESSGVEPVYEMVDMIQAHRAYETNMNFLRIQDETLGQTVRRVSASA